MDAGVQQDQQRAQPCAEFMEAEQAPGLAPGNVLALAQRIGQRRQDQERARNAEVAPDPDQTGAVEQVVSGQRGGRKQAHQRQEGEDVPTP